MAFKIFDKAGAPHRFDSRDACENFLLAQGYSAIDAKHYADRVTPEGTRTDGERVVRLDESKLDARQRMIKRETTLKPLGQSLFQKDK
jgi:hypothetical protein